MKNSTQECNRLIARLAGYTAAAGAMITLAHDANAQVVYSGMQNIPLDPLPDTLHLDMNNDAVIDFNFVGNFYSFSGTYTGPTSTFQYSVKYGNAFVLNGRTDTYNSVLLNPVTYSPRALDEDVNINAAQSYWWHAAGFTTYYAALTYGLSYNWTYLSTGGEPYETQYHIGYSAGNFAGKIKYLGVRFHIGPNMHYGWVRINAADFGSLYVVDWAYDQNPNKGIITGDKPPQVVLNAGVVSTHEKTVVVSVTFNEEVTGLSAGDFVVGNGSASNLSEWISGREYTIEVTANNPGEVSIELPADAVNDLSGNPNSAAVVSYTYEEIVTDINEISDSDFKLYPNPVSDRLTIVSETEAKIMVIDLNGRIVLNMENILEKTVDTGNLPEGIYTMKVITNEGVSVHKFVKE